MAVEDTQAVDTDTGIPVEDIVEGRHQQVVVEAAEAAQSYLEPYLEEAFLLVAEGGVMSCLVEVEVGAATANHLFQVMVD